MKQVLSDEQIMASSAAFWLSHGGFNVRGFARAIEAAVLASIGLTADVQGDAERWKWLKMQSTIGEQKKIMSTPWHGWDKFADSCRGVAQPSDTKDANAQPSTEQ